MRRLVSQSEKSLNDEIKALKRMPRNAERKTQIIEKRRKINSLKGSALDADNNMTYKSYEGKFSNGQKAVAVFEKYDDDLEWEAAALFTWMTRAEASSVFGVDLSSVEVEAYNCGFEFGFWYSDDNSEDWTYLDPFKKDLGIVGAKGYFIGYNYDIYYTDPKDILRGQKILFLIDENRISNVDVTFPSSASWVYFIIALLLLYIAFHAFRLVRTK